VDTKVALIDSFHILFTQLLEDMSLAKGRSLGIEAERAFNIVFALLEQSNSYSSTSASDTVPLTPFLNRSILADYQQSYSLSKTLVSALKHSEEKDARLDILESALAGFDPDGSGKKDPGALKIVLHSYGIQQGIDNLGNRNKPQQASQMRSTTTSSNHQTVPPSTSIHISRKGKAKAADTVEDPERDIKVTQVLDVLPDLSSDYVRLLLGSARYKGDSEQVLGALLEGNAASEEALLQELENEGHPPQQTPVTSDGYNLSQRRNVFDDQEMDLSQVTMGKKDIEYVSSALY
jgi:activating signal cointegrator complex subunit 2